MMEQPPANRSHSPENPAELIDGFFNNLESIPDMNIDVARVLRELHFAGKLTPTNIGNTLRTLRETKLERDHEN